MSNESRSLFTYQFEQLSKWQLASEGLSTDDHFMWVGASDRAFPLEITVDVLDGNVQTIASCEVLPPRHSPSCVVTGNKRVVVTLGARGYYYLEINGKAYGKTHPLFIFVDPLQLCPYSNTTQKMHYFAAGYHDIGPEYPI